MNPREPEIAAGSPAEPTRRRAPLNSVSTRIILCVFFSTLLTALIVSWLSVGAIHQDVRTRIAARAAVVLDRQAAEIESSHASAFARLSAASAIGSDWHAALVAALDARPDTRSWDWQSTPIAEDSRVRSLPTPPPDVAARFDRLTLRRDGPGPEVRDACLPTGIDLIRSDSSVAGHLEGCVGNESLYDALQPASADVRGWRLLVATADGRIAVAGGIRASARIGQRLPMADLFHPADGALARYEDDQGTDLVGRLLPLGRSGWYLVAETEHARAFAPAIAITNQIFIVDICIILLFSVLAYKITLAIMQPIEALSRGAQRIAEGHVDYEIPMPANDDELGLLTGTFNGMMRKLRSSQLEIENDRIRLHEKNEELQRANEILAQLSITDGLTKLHNHRYFQDHLTREIKRVSRTHAPLSLILLDIDDFKLLNDTHGHAAGDEVLVALAAIMNDSARESDLIARYGGEEFVILMPNTDLAGAVHLAEKIRMTVESTRLIIGDNMKPINITISLGVALFNGDRREFFVEADKALYTAKENGKNCVIIAGNEGAEIP
ncbi:MAG: diguanylate cyclase [bacterium]|nr:diguanylate cyclase [bacterium]